MISDIMYSKVSHTIYCHTILGLFLEEVGWLKSQKQSRHNGRDLELLPHESAAHERRVHFTREALPSSVYVSVVLSSLLLLLLLWVVCTRAIAHLVDRQVSWLTDGFCGATVDGWHKIESSEGMTIKNQVVGFLIAVQYLRGKWIAERHERYHLMALECVSILTLCLLVPLIVVNAMMIVLELLMG